MAPSTRKEEQNLPVNTNHKDDFPKKKPRHTPASRREAPAANASAYRGYV